MLTKKDLDPMRCSTPGCSHSGHEGERMSLRGRCHPAAGSRVHYDPLIGAIAVECRECERLIAEIAVADGAEAARAKGPLPPGRRWWRVLVDENGHLQEFEDAGVWIGDYDAGSGTEP